MEGKGSPAKKVKVNTSAAGGLNIKINRGPSKQIPLNVQSKPKTVGDYVPPAMDDPALDKTIDDIIASESNEVLAAEDAMYDTLNNPKKKKQSRLKKIFKSKWFYIAIAAVIICLFALPYTRYLILGPFFKDNYQLVLTDSVTDQPVSEASVSIDKMTKTTDSRGEVKFKLPLGRYKYVISKKYYATTNGYVFIGFTKPKVNQVHLMATGRQVPITVINKISGRRLGGVKISVLDTSAETNSQGQTNIVLPTAKSSYQATITANSFDTLSVPIQVTTSATANTIGLIPAGNIYYLSNATGTINVIKANLDGSNPVIELSGTGAESAANTVLLPSPDWNYLLLQAKRSGSQPELYIINTKTGNLTEFDSSASTFNLIGWSGDQFIYDETNTSADPSTVGREEVKSYNAQDQQLNVLDENQVNGTAPSYAYQSFSNFQLLPNLLVYTTTWTSVGGYDLSSTNDTIRSVEPNGLNKKDYSSYPATATSQITLARYQPAAIYISVNNSQTNQISYYTFSNGAVNSSSISASTFSQLNPTYYISPSGENSIWSANQGSELETFVGNSSGQNGQRVTIPAGYTTIGWYDNLYILLTQNSKLYIAPSAGSNSPILIGSYLPNA